MHGFGLTWTGTSPSGQIKWTSAVDNAMSLTCWYSMKDSEIGTLCFNVLFDEPFPGDDLDGDGVAGSDGDAARLSGNKLQASKWPNSSANHFTSNIHETQTFRTDSDTFQVRFGVWPTCWSIWCLTTTFPPSAPHLIRSAWGKQNRILVFILGGEPCKP